MLKQRILIGAAVLTLICLTFFGCGQQETTEQLSPSSLEQDASRSDSSSKSESSSQSTPSSALDSAVSMETFQPESSSSPASQLEQASSKPASIPPREQQPQSPSVSSQDKHTVSSVKPTSSVSSSQPEVSSCPPSVSSKPEETECSSPPVSSQPESSSTPSIPDELKPYVYPFNIEAIKSDLIRYGESLGMTHRVTNPDGTLRMPQNCSWWNPRQISAQSTNPEIARRQLYEMIAFDCQDLNLKNFTIYIEGSGGTYLIYMMH